MRALICLSMIVAIAAVIVVSSNSDLGEPRYQGRSLSQWLQRLDDGEAGGISSTTLPSPTARQLEAAAAIRAMGPQVLPRLMHDLQVRPAQNAFRFRAERKINEVLRRVLHTRMDFPDTTEADRIRWRAAQGLAALGPLAKAAAPELQVLLYSNCWHSSIKEAAYALSALGPEGLAILTNAPPVIGWHEWSDMCAIWALGQHPATGTNVIPFLVEATHSLSEGTSCGAIQVLGLFHTEPDIVVPALTAALVSANPNVRNDAARALAAFGREAAAAVPSLETLTNDPAVRRSALKALRNIQVPGSN
jgi:HEAT repeats